MVFIPNFLSLWRTAGLTSGDPQADYTVKQGLFALNPLCGDDMDPVLPEEYSPPVHRGAPVGAVNKNTKK